MYRTMNLLTVVFVVIILATTNCVEFPLLEFLSSAIPTGVKDTITDPEDVLKSVYLCSRGAKCCSCESDCMASKSCCIDKLWNSSHPIPLQDYLQEFQKEAREFKEQNCLPAMPFVSVFSYSSDHYLMVDGCMPGASPNDTEMCLTDTRLPAEQRIPVFGDDRYIYKNSYCAKCNFVKTYFIANISASCNDGGFTALHQAATPDVTKFLKDFSGCNVGLGNTKLVKDMYFTSCYPEQQLVKTCSKNNRYKYLCANYDGKLGLFKNIHCYSCNNRNFSKISFPQEQCQLSPPQKRYSWSFTINFGGSTQITASGETEQETVLACPAGQIFSLLDGKCKTFTCGAGFETNGVSCEKVHENNLNVFIDKPGFTRCFATKDIFLYIKIKDNMVNISNFKTLFESDFNTTNEIFSLVFQAHSYTIYKRRAAISQALIQNFTNKLRKINLEAWNVVEEYMLSTIPQQLVTQMYGFEIPRTFNTQRLCAETQHITMISEGNFTNNCSFKINGTFLPYSSLNLWESYKQNETSETITYCSKFHLHSSCKMETFTDRYFTLTNKTIKLTTFKNQTLFYSADEYLPVRNGISICQKFVKKAKGDYGWQQTMNDIQHYISVVGTSLSIACHIFLILTYVLFKQLQNRGGLNVLAFICALLFSDTLFMIAASGIVEENNLCKVMAILLHWSLLVDTMWAVIIAGDIVKHFLRSNVRTSQTYVKRLFSYTVISITPPTLIIAVSVSINETKEVYVGYGSNGVCWIGAFYPLLASYMVPAVVGYLFSFICLCCVLRYFYKHKKRSRTILQHSNAKTIALSKIALKLVIVLGLSEILGLIQIYKSNLSENEMKFNSGFSMAYNITRSLRGAFICLIYLANKKTLELYKHRFYPKENVVDIRQKTITAKLESTAC